MPHVPPVCCWCLNESERSHSDALANKLALAPGIPKED
jgi:hypothetical protein